jgi:two-component system phosphate regulon response regulator PhoB
MKILIIEDSLFLRRANERALTRAGHEVISAGDGEDGLRLALEQNPDLVILDLILPKLPGREVLRQLHGNPHTAAIPVMIVSCLAQANDQKLLAEGATSYYEKARLLVDCGPDKFVQAANQLLCGSRDTRA